MSYDSKIYSTQQTKPYLSDYSTADKYYDIEESQKIYENLLNQNIRLKEELERKKHRAMQSVEQIQQCQIPYVNKMDQARNDLLLWHMMQRNQFMHEKVDKLKKTYEKQAKIIRKIESSEKWQNRRRCTEDNCYEEKYMQLLRIKSPFF